MWKRESSEGFHKGMFDYGWGKSITCHMGFGRQDAVHISRCSIMEVEYSRYRLWI